MDKFEFLDICYCYINRIIILDKFIDELKSINKEKYSKEDLEGINNLISNLEKISKEVPNEVDDYVIKEREKIKKLIDNLIKAREVVEKNPKKDDDETLKVFNEEIDRSKKEYGKEMDSMERWKKAFECLNNDELLNNYFDNLNDEELLKLIVEKHLWVPFPPQLQKDDFERLTKICMDKDKREWLWRLAYNYENYSFDFDKISDYFIMKKDAYYLVETVCILEDKLNIDAIIDKVLNADKDFKEDVASRYNVFEYMLTDKQKSKIFDYSKK